MTIKPWREIAVPHPDVLKGTFQQAEFAADITRVHQGDAPEAYQDAKLFFHRTYITEGMSLLLDAVVKRLAGREGDPIIQLQTAFGGGKTHTLLAVYHLARRHYPVTELLGVSTILDRAGVQDLPAARVAVIDGTNLGLSEPKKHGKLRCATLWGELAWQLAGEEGYEFVRSADESGTAPDKDSLIALLRLASPCVVLLDELVAYLRQFELGKHFPAGTYESNISFFQNLTEAVKAVDSAVLLASLPDSNDAGSGHGQVALRELEQVFRRLQKIWKPVTKDEAFHIVRRRLFDDIKDTKAMEDSCRSFAEFYIANQADFPPDTQEVRYMQRLIEAYPIHPELFDRLYEDWATLPNFQRTRGVLQLMALIIHRMWKDGNTDALIMPGGLPLTDPGVRNKAIDHLPQGWDPVIDQDIDGEHSRPAWIESQEARFGQVQAARRVARTIFLGSAPSAGNRATKGLELPDILLGSAVPDQSIGIYKDVCKRLADRLNYLNVEKDHYWFGTKPNLRREMESRKQRFRDEDDVFPLLQQRLASMLRGKGYFDGVHVFTDAADIPDDTGAPRLVVLSPAAPYSKTATEVAERAAAAILRKRGQQPRQRQNRLLFLAPDYDMLGRCKEHCRGLLAWRSILDDIDNEHLVVDTVQIKQAKAAFKDAEQALGRFVQETWRWLLGPMEEAGPKGFALHWEVLQLSASASDMMQEVQTRLREEDWIIAEWAPVHLRTLLDAWYFDKGAVDVGTGQVWADMCSYMYMPRLLRPDVLTSAIARGIESTDFFGYAQSVSGEGDERRYDGFAFGTRCTVAVDDTAVLIQREHAGAYQEQLLARTTAPVHPHGGGEAPAGISGDGTSTPVPGAGSVDSSQKDQPIRYYGVVTIDPIKAKLQFADIIDEVVHHLRSDPHTVVEILVEITARNPSGIDADTRRTVKENGAQLGFRVGEWE
ncbi:MAG TPA: DUF499 domain-containing protein [Bacteroidota bacterium]|nr:DUF499 domain-containing protein [Bacteroidota bacterium]